MATIAEIVDEVNKRAGEHPIGTLPSLRKKLKGLSRRPPGKVFRLFQSYAFHWGGRTELQFNIGSEPRMHFRYGVAFSLQTSRSLPSIKPLIPRVNRFNEFLRQHPEALADLRMWYYAGDSRSKVFAPAAIPPELVRPGVFMFLGEVADRRTEIDYDRILEILGRLLPLYQFVEGAESYPLISERSKKFIFRAGCTLKLTPTVSSVSAKELDISLRHKELGLVLYRRLKSKYGQAAVSTEQPTGTGESVDVVVRRGNARYWFYEIKTAISARGCIREALAQLLVYAFWPNVERAERLIVVGEPVLDSDSGRFLRMLRRRYRLPIYYDRIRLRPNSRKTPS